MKKHQLFFEKYNQILDSNEQRGFMRGYMLHLTAKQLQSFFAENTKNGLSAVQKLSTGDSDDKKKSLSMLDNLTSICQDLKGLMAQTA